jgi:hypothetical protein
MIYRFMTISESILGEDSMKVKGCVVFAKEKQVIVEG